MRYVGGTALLLLGAAVFPLPGQLAESVSAWLVALLSTGCFVAAYKLLAPPSAPAPDAAGKKGQAD